MVNYLRKEKLLRIPALIRNNGWTHSLHLAFVCLVLPGLMNAASHSLWIYLKLKRILEWCFTNKEFRYWRQHKEKILKHGNQGYKVSVEVLGLEPAQREIVDSLSQIQEEILIAEIDQDGFLLSHYGAMKNVPTISNEKFVPRKGTKLIVVSLNGYLGVKKHFKRKRRFIDELKALHRLYLTGCNVPAIRDVDFGNLTITTSYINGRVLREKLAERGAILRDRDVGSILNFSNMSSEEKWMERIHEGKKKLYEVINELFSEDLFLEIQKMHKARFTWNDLKYGNIIIEEKTGKPVLIDFVSARHFHELNDNLFRLLCDRDIELFNLHFDKEKITRQRLKKRIEHNKRRESRIYAPVYFGSGVRLSSIWSNHAGYGRWHYILRDNLPDFTNKRILDLGANNGFNGIQMLRNGAEEVIGVELDYDQICQGELIKQGFEWTDHTYYNFRYVHANMKEVPLLDLGKFEMVTAFCSIYYLNDSDIYDLADHVSKITNVFVLQCNVATHTNSRSDPRTYERASVGFGLDVLENSGFAITKIIAPPNYSRPLVIGKKK